MLPWTSFPIIDIYIYSTTQINITVKHLDDSNKPTLRYCIKHKVCFISRNCLYVSALWKQRYMWLLRRFILLSFCFTEYLSTDLEFSSTTININATVCSAPISMFNQQILCPLETRRTMYLNSYLFNACWIDFLNLKYISEGRDKLSSF